MDKLYKNHDLRLPQPESVVEPLLSFNGAQTPTHLQGMQHWLVPHMDTMMVAWWGLLVLTMVYLTTKFIVIPLVQGKSES